ncbi:MAG: T9SS type A sorting domain-containing protein [Ignavibacteria bacterium]|nr:T9SS type A sorting domain-containing protein [Ignavibacteria bacterium]MBT8382363.1 T9SS type A sorting domain-containing protein [Ignavibacteria bacterium]MBT8390441.1 T9SS type A sorting domain-containing protein [Ignavibacteria bacterium]NNJ51775.1 T9SS type A sorting domain-containing protein [Ignavibacteriaceae bacterium]NNL22107.1 T9SS type A sorting domain-containing protein [Ignavibacteriaceae bacterium]
MKHIISFMIVVIWAFASSAALAQALHIVEVIDFDFIPMNVNAAVGDTIEWQWVEGDHTTTSDSTSGQNVWDAVIDQFNPTFRFVITAPGVHSYHCTPHIALGMVGTITATQVNSISYLDNPLDDFVLNQNYPNPFNPTTTINFSIPQTSNVKLQVFNSIGENVQTLVNRELSAGNYNYEWGAKEFTSGIYFYTIQTGDFIETKKMILLK